MFSVALNPRQDYNASRRSLVGTGQFQFISFAAKTGQLYYVYSRPSTSTNEAEKASIFACDHLFPDELICVKQNVFSVPNNAAQCSGALSEDGETYGLLYTCETSTDADQRVLFEPCCVLILLDLSDFSAKQHMIRQAFYREDYGYRTELGHKTQLGWFVFPYWISDETFPAHLRNFKVYQLITRPASPPNENRIRRRLSHSDNCNRTAPPVIMDVQALSGSLVHIGGLGATVLLDGHLVKLAFMGTRSVQLDGAYSANMHVWRTSTLHLCPETPNTDHANQAPPITAHLHHPSSHDVYNSDRRFASSEFYMMTEPLCHGLALVPMLLRGHDDIFLHGWTSSTSMRDCLVSLQLDADSETVEGYRVVAQRCVDDQSPSLFTGNKVRWKVVYVKALGRALLVHVENSNDSGRVLVVQVAVDRPFRLKELCVMQLQRRYGRWTNGVLEAGLDRGELMRGRLLVK